MQRLAKKTGSMHSLTTQRVTHFVGIWTVYNQNKRADVTNRVWGYTWDRVCSLKWDIDNEKTRQD
jgi:hypothetical protein